MDYLLQERIDDYLFHRMSEKERSEFERELLFDSHIREQMAFTEDVRRVLKSRLDKLAMMNDWEDDYIWKNKIESTNNHHPEKLIIKPRQTTQIKLNKRPYSLVGRSFFYWTTGIAALFIAIFFFYNHLPVQDEIIGGNIGDNIQSELDNSDIKFMIDQGKYEEAINLIKVKDNALDQELIKIANENRLDKTLQQQITEKKEALKWLQIQALPGVNQKEDALILLDELRRRDGKYRKQADSMYNVLIR